MPEGFKFWKKSETKAEAPASTAGSEFARELLANIDTKENPLAALQTVKLNIDDVAEPGARAVLEGEYDKKAQELWTNLLWSNSSAPIPTTVEGTFPPANDVTVGEKYAQSLAELKAFDFYNQETKDAVIAQFEERLQKLAA